MSTLAIVLVIVGVVFFLIIAGVGVVAALGIYGARSYLVKAKEAEAQSLSRSLALGIVSCSVANRSAGKDPLPATANPVPASLADVSGRKYMSAPSDWTDPSYSCASFSISTPQYFQYQWVKEDKDHGVVRAVADLDGDGSPDASVETRVDCSATSCSAGTPAPR